MSYICKLVVLLEETGWMDNEDKATSFISNHDG